MPSIRDVVHVELGVSIVESHLDVGHAKDRLPDRLGRIERVDNVEGREGRWTHVSAVSILLLRWVSEMGGG